MTRCLMLANLYDNHFNYNPNVQHKMNLQLILLRLPFSTKPLGDMLVHAHPQREGSKDLQEEKQTTRNNVGTKKRGTKLGGPGKGRKESLDASLSTPLPPTPATNAMPPCPNDVSSIQAQTTYRLQVQPNLKSLLKECERSELGVGAVSRSPTHTHTQRDRRAATTKRRTLVTLASNRTRCVAEDTMGLLNGGRDKQQWSKDRLVDQSLDSLKPASSESTSAVSIVCQPQHTPAARPGSNPRKRHSHNASQPTYGAWPLQPR